MFISFSGYEINILTSGKSKMWKEYQILSQQDKERRLIFATFVVEIMCFNKSNLKKMIIFN